MNREELTIKWNIIAGCPIDVDRATAICQAEWQEFHKSNGKDLKELADVYFTAVWLKHCCEKRRKPYDSTLIKVTRLIDELNAWSWVDATISSNYTKFLDARDYSLVDASAMADRLAGERYRGVHPKRVEAFYVIIGDEYKDNELVVKGKVLKPETFKDASEFLL